MTEFVRKIVIFDLCYENAYGDSRPDPGPKSKFFVNWIQKWPFYGHSNLGPDWTLVVHRHRSQLCYMRSRIFNATQKRIPRLSTNFFRRTRNFGSPALHFLSYIDKLTQVSSRGPVCEVFLTNINLPTNDKKWRAGHLQFLVRLKKLVERPGVRFGVASKMRNFIRWTLCLDESLS